MKHRKPPKALLPGKPAQCRYCGGLILTTKGMLDLRRTWHPHCIETWLIANDAQYARYRVFLRDRGVCAECGTQTAGDPASHEKAIARWARLRVGSRPRALPGNWELDHIIALALAPRDMAYWGLTNMRTLCVACHKEKTARDMVLIRGTKRVRDR